MVWAQSSKEWSDFSETWKDSEKEEVVLQMPFWGCCLFAHVQLLLLKIPSVNRVKILLPIDPESNKKKLPENPSYSVALQKQVGYVNWENLKDKPFFFLELKHHLIWQ